MRAYIYKKQLVATGKFYIGKHNGNNIHYKGSGVAWLKDLKLYKNIKTEILEYVDDISKLNEREEWWLNKLDVVNNPLYYNKTNKSCGVCKTEEHTKLKQSLSSPKRKKIIQYTLAGDIIKIWNCMNDASKILNIKTGDLTCVCQGKQKTAGGFQWKIWTDSYSIKINPYIKQKRSLESRLNQSNKLKNIPKPIGFGEHRYKPVLQFDKYDNLIKEHKSIREACLSINQLISPGESNIGSCCNNKQKSAYGFVWKYKTIK